MTLFLGDGGVFNKMKKMTINAVKLANHLSSDSFNLHKSIKKNESYNEVAPIGESFPRILWFSETWLLTYLALVVPTVSAKPIFDTIDSFTFTREYVLNSRGKVSSVKVSHIIQSYYMTHMTASREKPTQGKIIKHPSQGAMKNLIQFGQNSLDQDLKGMGFSTYSFKGWKVRPLP